jgi:hypothetical protein
MKKKPKIIELSEAEKKAMADSHKFAKALTQVRKPVKLQEGKK